MRRVARLLHGAGFAAVYSSPRSRALESARFIAASHHLAVRTDPRFCEIDFGALEGLTYEEAATRYPGVYRSWMEHPGEVRFPGGESLPRMRARVLAALRELLRAHADQTIAVVSHAGVARILLGEALGVQASDFFRMEQSFGAVSVIDYYGAAPVVRLLNAVPTPDLGLRC
jgi:broad specificity phosphatase PhoE